MSDKDQLANDALEFAQVVMITMLLFIICIIAMYGIAALLTM